jgi:hypothetical protein
MGVPLLALTMLGLLAAGIAAVFATLRGRTRVARSIVLVAAAWVAAYASLLVVTSIASRERTLAFGETKRFCGFYLDCHLGLSVDGTEIVKSIMSPSGPVTASGMFHVVRLRLHNSARNPVINMTLYEPIVKVVDAVGNQYPRATAAERALGSASTSAKPLPRETRVTHEPAYATLVFDLPADVRDPRLLVTDGWVIDRALEFVLINDENSIFHSRTLLALDGAPEVGLTP